MGKWAHRAALASCRASLPAPALDGADYLYLWTASADRTQPDFLAVLDVSERNGRYGRLVTISVLQTNMGALTVTVTGLEVSLSEVREGMDVMAADIHRLGVLQEAAQADAKVPCESDAGLREHMDRQFELSRRELREALAPITLTLRAHTEQLKALTNH